jgi:predicted transcriptional regulator
MVSIFVMKLEKEVSKFYNLYLKMDIQLEKIELIKMLQETNDSSIILAIRNIFKTEKKDWWDELSEEQKIEIKNGIEDFENGRVYTYEEVLKNYL